jgi:PAS domain S-box-containing protein
MIEEGLRKGRITMAAKTNQKKNAAIQSSVKKQKRQFQDPPASDVTTQKQIQERETFYSVLQEAPNGVALIDKDGKYLFINAEFNDITGYTLQDIPIGREWFRKAFPDPEYRRQVIGTWKTDMARKKFDRTFSVVCKDGKVKEIEFKGAVLEDERSVIMLSDITERKRMEQALQESREDLNRAQAVAHTGSWRLDVRRNELLWSDENHRIFGIPSGTPMTYETFLGTVHPEDREYVNQQWQAGLRGEPYDIEHRIVVDGQVKWVRERAELEFDEQGRLRGGFGTTENITGRKAMEEALRLQRDNLINIMESMPDGVYILNRDYTIPYANRALTERFGRYEGKRCYEYLAHSPEMCLECRQSPGQACTTERKEWRPSGSDIIYDVMSTPLLNPDGTQSTLKILRDITDIKRQEEELREVREHLERQVSQRTADLEKMVDQLQSEVAQRRKLTEELRDTNELLERIFATTHLSIAYMDDRFNFIRVNRAYAQADGHHEEYFIGKNHFALYPHPWNEAIFRRAVETGEPYHAYAKSFKYPGRPERGTTYWDWSLYPVRNASGIIEGLLLCLVDVTERVQFQEESVRLGKAIEEAMEERLRLAVVMEQTTEGVMITDTYGSIEYVNPAFEGLSGYRRHELVGRQCGTLVPYAEFGQAMETVRRGEVWMGHLIRRQKGGDLSELDVTLSPVRNPEGEIINYVAVERDMTHEVQLQRQMRQMQKMEALGTLAGGIAHDLNNVLMPITINAEMAMDTVPERSPAQRYLEQVLEAAHRGSDLVKQITAFSRRQETYAGPTVVAPHIKEILKLLRSSVPPTVEIRQHIETRNAAVRMDPVHLHQVLMNLCTNAADAMQPEGGLLEVGLSTCKLDQDASPSLPDLPPGPYVALTVTDTGHGMDQSVKERIFDPFFTTKGPRKGTGMGLAVVHGIIKSLGGAIQVHSEKGRGSRFTVFLPQVRGRPVRKAAPPRPAAAPTGTKRILFVDDEEAIVRSAQPLLEQLGYGVVAATSSPEALKLFRSQPEAFDLVITDQLMPQMSGLDLAQEVMRIKPDIPVILCTGFSEQISERDAKARGIRKFIMKPLTTGGMAETIRQALEGGD